MNKQEYEKDLFERLITSMKNHGLEECSDGVFLAGSFGRDEATYYNTEDGVVLKSDVEIGIIFKSKKGVKKMIDEIIPEFSEELSCMPLSRHRMTHLDNFNHAVFPTKKKSLFMYDIVNGNRHLWGKDYLENKDVSLSDVDIYEAKRIVANRIGELIYTRKKNEKDAKRWEAKLISAIGSAYLLLTGKYECSYYLQMEKAEEVKNELDECIGEGFFEKYKEAFSYLRENASEFDINDELLREYVKNINELFIKHNIKKPKINTLSRNLKYILKFVKTIKSLNCFGIEEKIINSLMSEYINGDDNIVKTSELWYSVLY